MSKQDRYWWEHEYETLDYYDLTLEAAWTDKKGVQRVCRAIDYHVYMVGVVSREKLRRYLRDEIPVREFYLKHVEEMQRMRLTRHGVDFEEWDQKDFEDSLPESHLMYYGVDLEDEDERIDS